MRFAHFFVDRPIFASVISLLVVLVGSIAFVNLPVSQYPEIVPPTIVVRTQYPGADAETIAATVATPLEQEINGVEDMLYMSSYSSSDGSMSLTITFRLGTDLNQAQVLVQNRVAVATPRLPAEVVRLGVTTRKSSPDLMMVVHMLSPDGSLDQLYISNYSRIRVRDILLRLNGVGDVTIFGEREYSLRIWLDPDRLASYGLSATEVVNSLRDQNVQVTGGALGAPPAPSGVAFQLNVTTQGRFETVDQFRQVIVKATPDGRLVRLDDIARVELGARDYVTNSYLNGKPAVALAIFQRPGTNALAAAGDIVAAMESLKRDFPQGLSYAIIYNPTEFIAESVSAVYRSLFESCVLVVLVILLFLQSWRTAVIPIIAIPVSLIGTFAAMSAAGFSINTLTLFGLVLAIGIVVDDAIVVIENVERNIAGGMGPREAAHVTMDEVGTAVVAIALVLSAVFVPTAFIPGITGQFYRQFALTIAVSTIISAIVSLTLSPALAAILLRSHGSAHAAGHWPARAAAALASGFNRGFDALSRAYAASVRFVAQQKLVALTIYTALIGATVWLNATLPRGFIPKLDQGYAIVVVQLPEGASLARTDAVILKATDILLNTPGVWSPVAFSGFSGATFTNASNAGAIFARFTPFRERAEKGLTVDVVVRDIIQRLSVIEEAFIIALPPPPVRGLGTAGGFKLQLQERDTADVRRVLATAREIMARARQTPGLLGIFTTFSASSPQIYLEIDRVKARMLNVPIPAIFDALQVNLGTSYVNDFNAFGRVYQVRAQADQRFRLDREAIGQLKVRSATGALVPFGTIAEIKDVSGPDLVQRFNMYTSVPLQGAAAPGYSSGQAIAAMEQLASEVSPQGVGSEWTELAFQEKLIGNAGIVILFLSVLFVFLVLAAQYESWSLPLAILLIVPMSVLSALTGVLLRGMENNILTQIGLVVLVGLAAKNAILIVEFARQQEESEGRTPLEAVVEACRLRLRPILMTAMAFILGVVPLMLATGAGAEMRQSLGTAVFFGMLGVTAFGLVLTPVFYVAIRALSGAGKRQPRTASGPGPGPVKPEPQHS
jgi:hydrophobic/amphiphilic exporter-1 (mainly G- bacteria), HAE1 family